MNYADKKQLMVEAASKFKKSIATTGNLSAEFFRQGLARLENAGWHCKLRSEPNEQNARALLWIAENREPLDRMGRSMQPV